MNRRLRIVLPAVVTIFSAALLLSSYSGQSVERKHPRSGGGGTLPVYAPGAAIPACYDSRKGDLRVVAPFGVEGASAPNCRPPAPWDGVNVPAGGWDTISCNAGGSFSCNAAEFFTYLNTH